MKICFSNYFSFVRNLIDFTLIFVFSPNLLINRMETPTVSPSTSPISDDTRSAKDTAAILRGSVIPISPL